MSNQKKITGVKRGVSTQADARLAVEEIYSQLQQDNAQFILFYCSPEYDLDILAQSLVEYFPEIQIMGCTTAGEITPQGYLDGSLTAISIALKDFHVEVAGISGIDKFEMGQGQALINELTQRYNKQGSILTAANSFAFMLIDGMSMKEELVTSSLYQALGEIQIIGGSAGDGVNFKDTFVFYEGAFHKNAVAVALVNTNKPFKIFKTEHFEASEEKIVVTAADAEKRIVYELNGEAAADVFARMIGVSVEQLTPEVFATNPVTVKIAGKIFVRSLQKVNDDRSLTFYCAIDEGIVLSVGKGVDMLANLEKAFKDVNEEMGECNFVFGCDCILRNLEMKDKNIVDQIGKIFTDNNVIGFSTYGEQMDAMHMNQTFTGVAVGL